jgi:arabinogalactan endo-1,4-beta-galactosidase
MIKRVDIAVRKKPLSWLYAQKMGMRIMINFHYSDTWADPGKQAKPTAWANHSLQNY